MIEQVNQWMEESTIVSIVCLADKFFPSERICHQRNAVFWSLGALCRDSVLLFPITHPYEGKPGCILWYTQHPWVELCQVTITYLSWFVYGVACIWTRGKGKYKVGDTWEINSSWQNPPELEILLASTTVARRGYLLSSVTGDLTPWGLPFSLSVSPN